MNILNLVWAPHASIICIPIVNLFFKFPKTGSKNNSDDFMFLVSKNHCQKYFGRSYFPSFPKPHPTLDRPFHFSWCMLVLPTLFYDQFCCSHNAIPLSSQNPSLRWSARRIDRKNSQEIHTVESWNWHLNFEKYPNLQIISQHFGWG